MSNRNFVDQNLPANERIALGKSLRKQVPHSNHGKWSPAPDRPDPLSLLSRFE